MQKLGLNTDINVGGKRLHVQTSYGEATSSIVANVFDGGRVVEARETKIAPNTLNGELENKIKELHHEMVADVELLFYIAEKVRQVKHPISCNKMGLILYAKGFIDEAIEFFELAISVDSDYAEAYNLLGLCYFDKKDINKAEEILRKGLEKARNYADLNLNLGRVYTEKATYLEAIQALDRALSLNQQYFAAHFYMGVALLKSLVDKVDNGQLPPATVRIKRALEHLDRATDLFTPMKDENYVKARSALVANDFESALKYYQFAFDGSQQRMDLTFEHEFYLKFMYGGKGKDNQFIGSYVERLKNAIKDYPEYADLHNNLGIAYLIMCRNLFIKALEEFRKSLQINPLFKRAEKNLKLAENDGKGFLILLRAILK